jgi:hypothetical protein
MSRELWGQPHDRFESESALSMSCPILFSKLPKLLEVIGYLLVGHK